MVRPLFIPAFWPRGHPFQVKIVPVSNVIQLLWLLGVAITFPNFPRTAVGGNKDSTLRAPIASVCGAPCGNPTSRMPGPDIILDDGRPGGEASRVPRLFQR